MLTTLSRSLGRENGEHRDTREEEKDAGLQTPGKTARIKSSWEGAVSSGGNWEFPGAGGLELTFPEMGIRSWNLWEATGLHYIPESQVFHLSQKSRAGKVWWFEYD